MTGFSLFITVFIVLGAAGLVLAMRGGKGAPGGVQSCLWGAGVGLRAPPWDQWVPMVPVAWGEGSMAAETGAPETPQPKGNLYWGLSSH